MKVDDLLAALRPLARKKGEFETTAEYEGKFTPALEKIAAKARATTDQERVILAFPLRPSSMSYDADKGQITIGSTVSRYIGLLPSKWALGAEGYIPTSSKRVGSSTYVGSNAFGVKKNVIKIATMDTGVLVPGKALSGWPSEFSAITKAMAPRDAMVAKNSMYVMMAGRLLPPFVVTGEAYQGATISLPIESATKVEALKFTPECAIVYDAGSKQVMGSVPFKR
ncbi:hypothetical protein [Azospirillum lipoferum]|uniref:hypothetical protein n=1 Tax=Azospirillum lipoferum TaxID=193 RepID=UPI0005CB2AD9|nr:hypothetical protein [Azospirillum lipoferum]